MSIPSDLPQPRLCNLKKWPTYAGYGFNLHAEKGKPGQYIGKVDPNSPAETGGLGQKFFLIEVNGANVEDLSHQKVVERIKETPNKVTMLVAPSETYKYCKEHKIVITINTPNVEIYTTPDEEPGASETIQKESGAVEQLTPPPSQPPPEEAQSPSPVPDHDEADYSVPDHDEADYAVPDYSTQQPVFAEQLSAVSSQTASPAPSPQQQRRSSPTPPAPVAEAPSPTPPAPVAEAPSPTPPAPVAKAAAPAAAAQNGGGGKGSDPVGNISLEEMRAKIGQNKRTQVKMKPGTFSEKSNMFQSL
ncbi:hypothetical protein BOX15_Mlig006562g1 [Macrostomum lignano]|uniref:PDZ domain-containing protein n=1 Tax=Macrostomum lignano TaxID=282301 RepID=A0A267EEW2_9PLAT|nr:hypothetical protein BOX15_Mlig006562g1 [Macrostomum lignano]